MSEQNENLQAITEDEGGVEGSVEDSLGDATSGKGGDFINSDPDP